MIPVSYNIRSLFVRKANTVATALGIALVVFVLAASQMLANGVRNMMGRSGRPGHAIVLRKGSDAELSSGIEQSQLNLVLAAPGVKRNSQGNPVGAGEVVLVLALNRAGTEEQVANVMVRGVSESSYALRPEVQVLEGRRPRPATNEVMIGEKVVGQYEGLSLGGSFTLNKNRTARVVGVFAAGGSAAESEIWADLDTLRAAFGRENTLSSITVQLESPSKFDGFRAAVEDNKQLGLLTQRQSEFFERQSEGSATFLSVLGGIIVAFFSVGAMIGAMITMYAAVQNRRKEIGTLRALGFSKFTIMVSFLLESLVLSLIGGALGVLSSLAMGFVEFSMMNAVSWSEITFRFEPAPQILVTSLVLGGVMGLVGGFFPALQAASVSPLAAMRE